MSCVSRRSITSLTGCKHLTASAEATKDRSWRPITGIYVATAILLITFETSATSIAIVTVGEGAFKPLPYVQRLS